VRTSFKLELEQYPYFLLDPVIQFCPEGQLEGVSEDGDGDNCDTSDRISLSVDFEQYPYLGLVPEIQFCPAGHDVEVTFPAGEGDIMTGLS
jgi:hypothetical protein